MCPRQPAGQCRRAPALRARIEAPDCQTVVGRSIGQRFCPGRQNVAVAVHRHSWQLGEPSLRKSCDRHGRAPGAAGFYPLYENVFGNALDESNVEIVVGEDRYVIQINRVGSGVFGPGRCARAKAPGPHLWSNPGVVVGHGENRVAARIDPDRARSRPPVNVAGQLRGYRPGASQYRREEMRVRIR